MKTGVWDKVKRLSANEEISSDRAFQVCQGKGERVSPCPDRAYAT